MSLDAHAAHDLAGDLLHALSEHIGDDEGIAQVLRHWLDTLTPDDAALVALASVWRTFTECLTRVPHEAPPGAVAFIRED